MKQLITILFVAFTLNASAIATFRTPPPANVCLQASLNYVTQSGKMGYVWTIPGTINVDYQITGGSTSSYFVALKWLTAGSKTVSVNYNLSGGGAYSTTYANPIPTVTGNTIFCDGDTATLFPSPTGGAWTAFNFRHSGFTIDSYGVMSHTGTGGDEGDVRYSLNGCTVDKHINVGYQPVPITSDDSVQAGNQILLTDYSGAMIGDYTWSSSDVGIATVNQGQPSTLTAISAGVVNVTYTIIHSPYAPTQSCSASKLITVTP